MTKLDLPAIKKLCEAAAVLIDDEVLRIVTRYSPAAAEVIVAERTLVPQLVEALEEAQKLVRVLGRSLTECSAPMKDSGGLIYNRRQLALLRLRENE